MTFMYYNNIKRKKRQTFRLPPQSRWELRSSALLRSEQWIFFSWPPKMGLIRCTETWVRNYHYTMH